MTSLLTSHPPAPERVITLRDIAQFVGVSVQSVSGVLNEGGTPKRVSAATRRRILDAAEELGYRRNHSAGAMRTGNTRMLGWLGGNLSEEHVGKMLKGALQEADAHGYTLKILCLGDMSNASQVIRRSSELRLMGVLALHLPVATQDELHVEAKNHGYPLVLMDERSEGTDIPQVVSDDEGGISDGIRHLVELGHRRIAFISAGEGTSVFVRSRENAFREAMAQHGLDVQPGLMEQASFSDHAPSIRAARALLSRPVFERPTAIFCSGDFIALATLQVAQELGIEVPAQLSVVGFANMGCLDFVTPRLTTVEQPFVEIGKKAVQVLLDVVESKAEQVHSPSAETTSSSSRDLPATGNFRLPTRFIAGASTGPPPGRLAP